jgi:hypothetical protein
MQTKDTNFVSYTLSTLSISIHCPLPSRSGPRHVQTTRSLQNPQYDSTIINTVVGCRARRQIKLRKSLTTALSFLDNFTIALPEEEVFFAQTLLCKELRKSFLVKAHARGDAHARKIPSRSQPPQCPAPSQILPSKVASPTRGNSFHHF